MNHHPYSSVRATSMLDKTCSLSCSKIQQTAHQKKIKVKQVWAWNGVLIKKSCLFWSKEKQQILIESPKERGPYKRPCTLQPEALAVAATRRESFIGEIRPVISEWLWCQMSLYQLKFEIKKRSLCSLISIMPLTRLVIDVMQLHGACRADEYMEVKRFKSLSASGGIWGGCSVGRVITLPMVTPSEAETEHIRTTHAPFVPDDSEST